MSDEWKPYDEDAARTRRLAILSELAQSHIGDSLKTPAVSAQAPTPQTSAVGAPPPVAPWRSPRAERRRVWWVLPVSLVLLLAVGFGGVYLLRGAAQTQQQRKVALPQDILVEANGLTCPRGAAWSPDGKDIAVVGYKDACPNNFPNFYQYHPGVLQVYDAGDGALLSAYQLDDSIQPKLGLSTTSAAQSAEVIYYDTVSWAPGGRRVAVTFGAFHWTQNPCFHPGPTVTGVLVTDAFTANGQSATAHAFDVFVRAPRANDFSAPIWDLQEARALSAPLVPALEYHWAADGRLNPMTPFSVGGKPVASQFGPVGDPKGSASFTIWQSGEVERHVNYTVTTATCAQAPIMTQTPPYTFQSDFSAWSPDGRFFAPDAGFEGLLQPDGAPTPDAKSLSDLNLTQAVSLPIRDAALAQVLSYLGGPASGLGSSGVAIARVAWRPDGKRLASYHAFVSTEVTGYDRILTLYDCATGKALGDLPPPKHTSPDQEDYESSRLYWAPDGSRLLLMDAQTSALRIWGADLLPK